MNNDLTLVYPRSIFFFFNLEISGSNEFFALLIHFKKLPKQRSNFTIGSHWFYMNLDYPNFQQPPPYLPTTTLGPTLGPTEYVQYFYYSKQPPRLSTYNYPRSQWECSILLYSMGIVQFIVLLPNMDAIRKQYATIY